ncbi:MAG: NEW3 domain-containing protein [Candidatus Thermoplasmatota archaeon]
MSATAYRLLVLGLVFGLASVSAQVPTSPVAAAVSVEAPATARISTDESVRIEVTVRSDVEPTDSPFDMEREVRLEVTGAPDGWAAQLAPSSFQLAPGATGKATLTVLVSAGAEADEVRLLLTARMAPLGLSAIPMVGPAADPEATDQATVVVMREDEPVREFVEAVGPAAIVAGMALLAVLVVVFALAAYRRRSTLRIDVEPSELAVRPGTSTTLRVTVRNTGGRSERILLDGGVVAGWEAEIPQHALELEPGAEEVVDVTVAASRRALASQLVLVAVAERRGVQPARRTVALKLA